MNTHSIQSYNNQEQINEVSSIIQEALTLQLLDNFHKKMPFACISYILHCVLPFELVQLIITFMINFNNACVISMHTHNDMAKQICSSKFGVNIYDNTQYYYHNRRDIDVITSKITKNAFQYHNNKKESILIYTDAYVGLIKDAIVVNLCPKYLLLWSQGTNYNKSLSVDSEYLDYSLEYTMRKNVLFGGDLFNLYFFIRNDN